MGIARLQKKDRTDRILILVALAMFILATGLFYFDNWMWGGRHERGESIGVIANRTGDVRMKFEGDLKWGKATSGQGLAYNDSIYAGSDSQAQLQLGKSDMTVTENTLIVLRREQNVNFMKLAYGGLFGNIAPTEKVVIDTGEGKPIELSSKNKTSILVKKSRGGRTELEVKAGEVDVLIGDKKTHLGKNTRMAFNDQAPKVEKVDLELVKPLSRDVIYAEDATKLEFLWRWSNGRAPAPNEKYTLEFSSTPGFERLVTKREVSGALNASLYAQQSLSMYYRVRGPAGEVSSSEKVNFVRLQPPLIVKPVASSQFQVPANSSAHVDIEFNKPQRASVWFQVSNDPRFESVLSVDQTVESKLAREFPPGQYYLRAKSDYGDNHESGWTSGVPFTVTRALEGLTLDRVSPPSKILIPNASYPPALYHAEPARVKEFLSRRGFLQRFFSMNKEMFDSINLKFAGDAQVIKQTETSWPKEKMRPMMYSYTYQIEKQGYEASPWSTTQKLEIADEPPRATGEPRYGPLSAAGESEAQWTFTPLLFARSYDVQMAKDPSMMGAREWSVSSAEAKAKIIGENYWRARARDAQGRVISDYSQVYRLNPPVAPLLARHDQPRKPAATETTKTKVERMREEPFEKNGWWTWFGLGENYVDYAQSVKSRSNGLPGATVDYGHIKGPSEYLEVGFVGKNRWGGIFSATQSPGTFNPNVGSSSLDTTAYRWTSTSFEGVYRKASPFSLLGSPIVYGLRLGIQQHHLPYYFLDDNTNLNLRYNNAMNASAGLLAEWSRRRWTYYWMMRYQYPLSTSADGASQFTMDPVFSFDGSVGGAYNLTRQLKAGVFWYGQWHQFNFKYSDGTVANSGFQSLFYSDVDFRLGWDF